MAWLISGQNVTGTGSAAGQASIATYWSDVAYVFVESSANSASASLWASPDPAYGGWLQITAWALKGTATAQLTSFYPYLRAQVDWASGGTNTAKVNLQVVGRKMFP